MIYNADQDDTDEDFDLELLNGANPDPMWCPEPNNDFADLSVGGVVSPTGPLYMGSEYLGPPSGPGYYMGPPSGPGYIGPPSGPGFQYLGPYYSNMMIPNDSRLLLENNNNNNVELLPRQMDIRFPQTAVDDNFSMISGNIAMVGVKSKLFKGGHFLWCISCLILHICYLNRLQSFLSNPHQN